MLEIGKVYELKKSFPVFTKDAFFISTGKILDGEDLDKEIDKGELVTVLDITKNTFGSTDYSVYSILTSEYGHCTIFWATHGTDNEAFQLIC